MASGELATFRVFIAEYKTTLTTKFKNRRRWKMPNKNHVLALIPGTIVEILVKEGDIIKTGDSLLILDAMKMANIITMPFDGKVVKIHVVAGEIVPKKHLMIEIEPVS